MADPKVIFSAARPAFPLAIVTGLLALAVMLLLQPIPAHAQSCWSVLNYDANGKVTSDTMCEDGTGSGDQGSKKSKKPGANQKIVEPGEVMIMDPPVGAITKVRREGYKVIEEIRIPDLKTKILRLKTPEGVEVPDALKQLRQMFPGLPIDANDLLDLSSKPGPQLAQTQAPLDYSRKAVGWGAVPNSCGAGLKIGMIDGAVDVNHRALKGQKVKFKSFLGKGKKPAEVNHGTAVAVILVGKPNVAGNPGGLLPGAELLAAGIFEKRGGRKVGNLAAMVRAVSWFVREKVTLVNLSIAGSHNQIMERLLDRASIKGLLMVAAAGNKGKKAPPAWPAAHDKVLAVTAVDEDMSIYEWANRGQYIDFAAPGVAIDTMTPSGRKQQSGTSFAAPFITGMVAVHLMEGYSADPNKIRASMKKYSRDLGRSGKDKTFGWGLVRLRPRC